MNSVTHHEWRELRDMSKERYISLELAEPWNPPPSWTEPSRVQRKQDRSWFWADCAISCIFVGVIAALALGAI